MGVRTAAAAAAVDVVAAGGEMVPEAYVIGASLALAASAVDTRARSKILEHSTVEEALWNCGGRYKGVIGVVAQWVTDRCAVIDPIPMSSPK